MKNNLIDKISSQSHFFNEIPREELTVLFQNIVPVTIPKDGYYLKEGQVPNRIGFVRSGILRLFYLDNTGKDVTKHFCPENSMAISYSGFIKQTPSRFSIQAIEKSRLLTIDFETYQLLLNRHSCWQIAARKLAEIVFILKEKREAELLLDDAQTRYTQFLEDYPGLINRIKQYYISSYLGITPESLSRIRAKVR